GGLVAAGERAVRVAGGGGAAQVCGDGFGGGADVQRQADGGQQPAVEGGAQPRGQPVRTGQGVGGQAEQRPPQPVPRGGAERTVRVWRCAGRPAGARTPALTAAVRAGALTRPGGLADTSRLADTAGLAGNTLIAGPGGLAGPGVGVVADGVAGPGGLA